MILVTGGSGVLGSAILEAAQQEDIPVLAPTHAEFDVEDHDQSREYLGGHGDVRCLIHCAAVTDWNRCHEDPRRCFSVNAVGSWTLARLAKEKDLYFIQISTDAVFDGGYKEGGHTEEDLPKDPCSVYGISKLAAEHLVREVGGRHLVVRIGWFVGADPRIDRKFVGTILRRAASAGAVEAVDDKYGSLTYASHAATGLLHFCRTQPQGIRHLVNRGIVSRYDVAKAVLELWSPKTKLHRVSSDAFPSAVRRPSFSGMRTLHADALLPEWREALQEQFGTCR